MNPIDMWVVTYLGYFLIGLRLLFLIPEFKHFRYRKNDFFNFAALFLFFLSIALSFSSIPWEYNCFFLPSACLLLLINDFRIHYERKKGMPSWAKEILLFLNMLQLFWFISYIQ